MSLISCSECNAQISSAAGACPHCGCPTDPLVTLGNVSRSRPAPRRKATRQAVQVVEQTGKGWKSLMMLSSMMTIAGTVMACIANNNRDDSGIAIGVLLAIGGLGLFAFARIGAWWNHG